MCSPCADTALPVPGLPIRESTDQRLFNTSPWLIAVVHALHRLLVPRHPPCALDILTVIKPSSRSSKWFDETQFLNWPAVQFSRSGRGAIRGGLPRTVSQNSAVLVRGRSRFIRARMRADPNARPGPVDIPRTAHAFAWRDLNGLPRKEVIQPHLPVRLPCYDFTPIMSPTFDGFLP